MNSSWYYSENGGRIGPVSEMQLIDLGRRGVVRADTLVWSDGFADWTEFGRTEPGRALVAPAPQIPPVPGFASPPPMSPLPYHGVSASSYKIYDPASTRSLWGWMAGVLGGSAFSLMIGFVLASVAVGFFFLLLGYLGMLAANVLALTILYRSWAVIQDGQARTTPGKAIGFLFIPFFNLYWVFEAFKGLATDMNAYCDARSISGPRISGGLVLTCLILTFFSSLIIPGMVALVLYSFMMKQFADTAARICEVKRGAPAFQ